MTIEQFTAHLSPRCGVHGRRLFGRAAGFSGLFAFVTFNLGWILGDLAQAPAFSPARDDISYLGALTARSPWLYDRLAANVSGALIVTLAFGLWRALSPSRLGRVGAAALVATGAGMFLDGIFRLDCQSIDAACSNNSWHSHAHKIESGLTVGFTFVSILFLALAFRRLAHWRDSWLPTIAAIPAIFIANLVFSPIGAGAATRAGTVVVLCVVAFLGLRLLQHSATHQSSRPAVKRASLGSARCSSSGSAAGRLTVSHLLRASAGWPGPVFRNDP